MFREYKFFLKDIIKSIDKIQKYAQAYNNATELLNESMAFEAVIYNLEVIGEAVKNIPIKIRRNYPHIDWKQIAGTRDKLIHQYHGIDEEIVWDIITDKLPELKKQMERILSDLS